MFQKKRRTFSISDFERISADFAEADNRGNLTLTAAFLQRRSKRCPPGKGKLWVCITRKG